MRKFIYILLSFSPLFLNGAYIKNLVQLDGDRDNQLVGYGLVVGLDGKGDSSADASTARQSIDL